MTDLNRLAIEDVKINDNLSGVYGGPTSLATSAWAASCQY